MNNTSWPAIGAWSGIAAIAFATTASHYGTVGGFFAAAQAIRLLTLKIRHQRQ